MTPALLQFDEEKHEYRLDGRVVPGVTTILKPISEAEYRSVDAATLDVAAWRGRAVHKMIELDLRDDLDLDALSDDLQPFYTAWKGFQSLSGFEFRLSEARVYSSAYDFAGTLDLAGMLAGRHVVIDAKRTVAVPRTAAPQTAAYLCALTETMPEYADADRYALHLRPDGSWRLVPFIDRNDLRVFLSALTLHRWMNQE